MSNRHGDDRVTSSPEAAGAAGTTAALGAEAAPAPTVFVATTVKVYGTPLVRPSTTQFSWPSVWQVLPSGAEVTVYPVTAEPPSDVGAVQETVAVPSPAVAVTPPGAPGASTENSAVSVASNRESEEM